MLKITADNKLHCGICNDSLLGFSQHRSVLPDRNELRNPQRQPLVIIPIRRKKFHLACHISSDDVTNEVKSETH